MSNPLPALLSPRRSVFAALAMFAFAGLAGCGGQERGDEAAAPAEVADSLAGHYAIATANPHATEAGAAVLARGGTAVDAAIAVQAVLGLVEPQSSGFGGGAFMLYYDPASGDLTSYDGRETAPASASPEMFLNADGTPVNFYDAITGGRAVGVPGVLAMLVQAHEHHGTLPLGELLAPAQALARDGFAISPRMAGPAARMT